MIKSFFITLSVIIFSFNVFANELPADSKLAKIEEGKQYVMLNKLPSPEKEVVEIFSFNCPSCYRVDNEFKIGEVIKNNLPEGVKFKKYSLNSYGPLAMELSEAWAIANILGIEKEVAKNIYNGIQIDRTIKTPDDIKKVFANLGVDDSKYESMKTNFLVKAFMIQQEQAAKELQTQSIPSFYVNGKYMINARGLDQTSIESSIKDYSRVSNYLLNLK